MYHGFGSDNGHFPQIQGCPAIPLEGKRGKKIGREWPKDQGHFKDIPGIPLEASEWEPREDALPWGTRLPWPLGRAAGGSRAQIWVLPYGVFSSRAFAAAPEKTGHPGRRWPRVRLAFLPALLRADRSLRRGGHRRAQPARGPPQLTHPAAACAQPPAGGVCGCTGPCVSVVGGGGPPSCSIRPFY